MILGKKYLEIHLHRRCSCLLNNNSSSLTLKMLPARGIGCGLRTLNSLRPVSTSCPWDHNPANQLPKALLDSNKLPQNLGVVGAVEGKTQSSRDFTIRATHLSSQCNFLLDNSNVKLTATHALLCRFRESSSGDCGNSTKTTAACCSRPKNQNVASSR